jgi:elongation factor 3
LSNSKKPGHERLAESALHAFEAMATFLGPPVAPILLPHLLSIVDLYPEKGNVDPKISTAVPQKIIKLVPAEGTRSLLGALVVVLGDGKWKNKVKALHLIRTWATKYKDHVALCLGDVMPQVEGAMHDTKSEVKSPNPL